MHEILTYLPQILPAYVAYLIAVISPGPAIMAIVSTSMTHGRKAGMTIALGIFAGSFTWACAAALGLATILQTYAIALEILKVFGGLYLLYLAYKAFKAVRANNDLPTAVVQRNLSTRASCCAAMVSTSPIRRPSSHGWRSSRSACRRARRHPSPA